MNSAFGSYALLISSLILLLGGCRKPDREDMERPQMRVVTSIPAFSTAFICGEQSPRTLRMEVGGTMQLEVLFTDDHELGSAKFDLHHNFDCHGHKSGGRDQEIFWAVLEVVELGGREQLVTRQFTAPPNTRPGNYHLGIQCLDAAGKEAEPIHLDVVVVDLSDTIPPVIELQQPGPGHIQSRSAPLTIQGMVTDDQEMGTGGKEITLFTPNGIELSVARIDHPSGIGPNAPFDLEYNIPGFVINGTCTLRVMAFDSRNNSTTVERHFELIE